MRARAIGVVVMAVMAQATWAEAHQPPPRYPRPRPTLEVTSWVGLGGGALVVEGAPRGVFDLRLGGGFTGAVGRKGDLRLGPWLEVSSATFATVQAAGGVELFVGAAPRPLRMFYYAGEGVFVARLGAGWAWRDVEPAAARAAPVATFTLAWGYRAPFSLREPEQETDDDASAAPRTGRYMTGARLWVGAAVDLTGAAAWQVSGGIEFEPVGSFRYLLGLY